MRGRWMATAIVGVSLLSAAATASTSTSFSGPTVRWEGASTVTLSSPVIDLRLPPEAGQAEFRLQAQHATVDFESQDKVVVKPVTSLATEPAETHRQEMAQLDSRWRAAESAGIFVDGTAGSTLSAAVTTGSLTVPTADCLPEPMYFTGTRQPACPPLAETVKVSVDAGSWVLEGEFSLSLWQWSEADADLWSGSRPTPASAGGVGQHEYRLLHLSVTKGRLEFFSSAAGLETFAPSVALAGSAEAAVAIAGEHAQTLTGARTFEVHRTATGLQTQAVAAGPGPHLRWTSLAVLACLMVVPPVAVLGRRKKASDHLLQASRNMMLGNYEAASRHALDAFRHRSFRQEAGVVAVIALMRGGQLDHAERFIARLGASHRPGPVTYLLANLRALQGRAQDARRLLDECLRLEPGLGAEIAANPLLGPVLAPGPGVGYQ